MKLAVIETGGKQYLVAEGNTIQVEKLSGEVESGFEFDKVLLKTDGDTVKIGAPYIDGAKVGATIVGAKRLPKVTTFKYHSKTRYRKKTGHRQPVTLVKITSI